jgi:hypothetical protein
VDATWIEHVPVLTLQHVPGHTPALHTAPRVQTFPTAHAACVVFVQAFPLQHVPSGCTHVLGVHIPASVQMLPESQSICAVSEQAPVAMTQQLPCGGAGHGLGVQVVATIHAFPAAHPGWVVVVQAPLATLQHVSIQVLPCGQPASVVVVQPFMSQHWPCGSGHGFGAHAPALNVPNVQRLSRTNVQPPEPRSQQAPGTPTVTTSGVTVTLPASTVAACGPHEPLLKRKLLKTWAEAWSSVMFSVRPVVSLIVYRNR